MSTAVSEAVGLPEAPYRGIEPFRFVDQQIFPGRDEEVWELLRYITVYRGVLLYGSSGAGKSSLINAGVIPAAIAAGFTPDRIRVQPRAGEEVVVERISTKSDGKAPYLDSNFGGASDASRIVFSAAAFKGELEGLPRGRRPLLIFDQFEELITLFEEAPRGEALREAWEAQQAVLGMLADVFSDQRLGVKLLFVFREDYLAKLNKLFLLCPKLPDQYLRLTPLRVESLPQIILGPFKKLPGVFERPLSRRLADDLEAEFGARNESGVLNLSEVEIACQRLWKEGGEDPGELFRQRKVGGLLEDYLTESLDGLAAELREPAIALLSRMITSSGTRNVITGEDLIRLTRYEEGDMPHESLEAALAALTDQTKLVRRERRDNSHFYEIVSEFLVPWIVRQKETRRERLESRKREEQSRRKRRQLILLAALSIFVAAAAAGVALFVYRERTTAAIKDDLVKSAEKARQEAEAARDQAVQQKEQAEAQRINAEQELNKALQDKADLTNQLNAARASAGSLSSQMDSCRAEAASWKDKYYGCAK
jgi:uncharacterized membrane protein